MTIPVVAIDGPGGSGKGTISQLLAARLGWHYLDSGALYRVLGLAAQDAGIPLTHAPALARLAGEIQIGFEPQGDGSARVMLNGRDVSLRLRTEACGRWASEVAVWPEVRAALLQKQHDFRQNPGLVADGRDMGTTVFPNAQLKIFLTASPEVRAARRYKQLKEKGLDASLPLLLGEIRARDARDAGRAASPLRPADDAEILDTSTMGINEVVEFILHRLRQRLGK